MHGMGRWHRLAGMVGVLVFLGTGVYLITHFPELHGGNAGIRYQFRANHAYILLSSLMNWGVGIYFVPKEAGWRRAAQRFGSMMLLAAPVVLLGAFFTEPARVARPAADHAGDGAAAGGDGDARAGARAWKDDMRRWMVRQRRPRGWPARARGAKESPASRTAFSGPPIATGT